MCQKESRKQIAAYVISSLFLDILNSKMKLQVDNDIHIELLLPVFAKRLYGLTNKNRAHFKKGLSWLD